MLTLQELCEKEVISLRDGVNLGRVDDLCLEEETAQVTAIIIYGKLRWFGLLGREEDLRISWSDIATIGQDAILVRTAPGQKEKKQKNPIKF